MAVRLKAIFVRWSSPFQHFIAEDEGWSGIKVICLFNRPEAPLALQGSQRGARFHNDVVSSGWEVGEDIGCKLSGPSSEFYDSQLFAQRIFRLLNSQVESERKGVVHGVGIKLTIGTTDDRAFCIEPMPGMIEGQVHEVSEREWPVLRDLVFNYLP